MNNKPREKSIKKSLTKWIKDCEEERRTFYNTKEALFFFEKETSEVVSLIYFYKILTLNSSSLIKTRKSAIEDFFAERKYSGVKQAYGEFIKNNTDCSLIYFARLYTVYNNR